MLTGTEFTLLQEIRNLLRRILEVLEEKKK